MSRLKIIWQIIIGNNRAGNSSKVIFAKSISQLIADGGKDFSPSSIKIRDGDIIEPCDRPMDCNLDDATKQGCYHPFTVRFSTSNVPAEMEEKEKNTAALFSEASKKIEAAGVLLEERKKAGKEGVEEEEVKEGSQDTVDVNSIMAKDVKMDEEEDGGSKDDVVVKSLDEKNEDKSSEVNTADGKVEEIKSSEDTLMVDVSASESTTQTEQSHATDGSTNVADTNLPAKTESTSTTEALKNACASLKQETKSSPEEEESSEEEYEFDDARQEIIDILQEIDSPGTYAVGGSCDGKLIVPGLVVDGVGPIGLPLSKSQAEELAKRCEQAPFGRGEKTIIDKSIRDTFQLAPHFFQITNPSWKTDMDAITKKVCLDLGVQYNLKVEAHLYKLLLYEEGSFFAPHRDSEKEQGMFGTLVIVLPSQFTGGELVVKHKGETETFRQEEKSSFFSQYAAFYADCKHELKKVTSGHRLCIVYNLVKCGVGMLPRAPDSSSLIKRLNAAASQWADDYDGNKIVLMTDHLYTPAGIKNGSGSARYKGSDAYVVELLESAIEKGANIDYDHGTLSLKEYGYAEGDEYGWGRWGSSDFSWVEATDRDLSLSLSSYGDVGVDESEEVIPEDFFEDLEPDDETFEPTGNEGINAERQYADSEAIVVWPRSKRWMIVTNNNISRMCSYLLKACSKGTSDSEPISECFQKAKSIIPRVVQSSADVATFVEILVMIGDDSLAKTFLSSYLKAPERSIDAIFGHIRAIVNLCGTEAVTSIVVEFLRTTKFVANPIGTATFILKYIKKEDLPQEQKENVMAAFVDCMCPPDKNVTGPLKASIDGFPLEAILALCLDKKPDNGKLAKRILGGYVQISCLEFKRYSYSYSSTKAAGPVLLVSSVSAILKLCESFGWTEYKDVLVDAVQKLCELGKSDLALDLVDNLAPKDGSNSDRSDICSELAGVACDKALTSLEKSKSPKECKSLLKVIGRYCPLKASKFVEIAEKLDFDTLLYPLVTDSNLRSNASDCVKSSLDRLTSHCSQVLRQRLSVDTGNVTIWALPNASLARNSTYSSFLRNPCKQILDWQVRKADHAGFMADLRGLIRAGDVKAESYQPRGRGAYHFKITKLKSRTVPASSVGSMKCPCSSNNSHSRYSSYRSYSAQTSCLLSKHKAVATKYQADTKKMNAIKLLLPATPEAAIQQKSQSISSHTFNVVYNTARLGLKTNFLNNKDIVVKDVTPGAPNADMIKAGDMIVGINGKRFEEVGVHVAGKFEQFMTLLKGTKRPMSVIFERPLTAVGNDEDANRKRPAATSGAPPVSNVGGNPSERSGATGSQQPPAKKAKKVDVIDLT